MDELIKHPAEDFFSLLILKHLYGNDYLLCIKAFSKHLFRLKCGMQVLVCAIVTLSFQFFSPSVKGKYYCVFIKCFHSIYMSIVYLQKKVHISENEVDIELGGTTSPRT